MPDNKTVTTDAKDLTPLQIRMLALKTKMKPYVKPAAAFAGAAALTVAAYTFGYKNGRSDLIEDAQDYLAEETDEIVIDTDSSTDE